MIVTIECPREIVISISTFMYSQSNNTRLKCHRGYLLLPVYVMQHREQAKLSGGSSTKSITRTFSLLECDCIRRTASMVGINIYKKMIATHHS
jgi:hypothetical protein